MARLRLTRSVAVARLAMLVGIGWMAAVAHGQEGSRASAGGPVRLVRSTSGTRGVQQGSRYVIEDPRTVFSPARDRQVVVYFEWEGRAGPHHCEARWKDPTGKVVLVSPIAYQATARRFGIYWSLTLPETATKGLWAVETVVNGHPAGTHAFEIADAAVAAAAPARRILSAAEIYKRALSSVATIEAIGPAGEVLARGSALALDADHVVAGFSTIEGATTLRIRSQGRSFETQDIVASNRRAGWAVLPVPGHRLTALARGGGVGIGDRCYVLDVAEDGTRVITEATIVGQEQTPPERLRLDGAFAAGSPVLDGEGALTGVVVAGGAEEDLGPVMMRNVMYAMVSTASGRMVVPSERLPAPSPTRVALAELARRGEFRPALSPGKRNIISGVFAARVQRGGTVPMPEDQKFVFSRQEKQASVFVQWNPQEKKDGQAWFEVYDADYRKVVRGDATKLKLRPGQLFFSTWTFDISRLPPAVYRVDLLLDEGPVWRGYLQLTE